MAFFERKAESVRAKDFFETRSLIPLEGLGIAGTSLSLAEESKEIGRIKSSKGGLNYFYLLNAPNSKEYTPEIRNRIVDALSTSWFHAESESHNTNSEPVLLVFLPDMAKSNPVHTGLHLRPVWTRSEQDAQHTILDFVKLERDQRHNPGAQLAVLSNIADILVKNQGKIEAYKNQDFELELQSGIEKYLNTSFLKATI